MVARKRRWITSRGSWEAATGLVLLLGLYLTSLHSYLLFHGLTELFTITVASGIFVIAWNSRRYLNNNYLLLVGISAIFVALIDLLHALAYEGMTVFASGGSDLATQLWIAARWLQALTFLAAPFFLRRTLRPYVAILVYVLATAFLLLTIFDWRVFPAAYVDGVGLTLFKRISEYLISLCLFGSIGLLLREREEFDPSVLRLLVGALGFFIASEITFTFYLSVYGEANMAGHFLRVIGFYALYKAIIVTGLDQPFALLLRDLTRTQDRLRDYATTLEVRNEALRESEERLREDAILLQERNVELDAYAHTVAHDLKNPLSAIAVSAEMVADVDYLTAETKRDLLGKIRSTARHMQRIVDDLLILSEVRRVGALAEPVNMNEVVANVRNRLSEMIRRRGARLTFLEEWPQALGYAPWIEEVWANYLSNALKHGGDPPVAELGATVQDDGMIRFWVADNGPGIDPSSESGLFVPFGELGKVRRAGSGLGLSIVQHIVTKLGGDVGVESEPGHGSRFFFTLPAAASPGEAAQTASASMKSEGLETGAAAATSGAMVPGAEAAGMETAPGSTASETFRARSSRSVSESEVPQDEIPTLRSDTAPAPRRPRPSP